jgi:carbon-monoxide dehydrogenase medium subunit
MSYIRRLPPFEYLTPRTLAETCSLLAEHGRKAAVLAGGTDLLLRMKRREKTPRYLVSLKNVPGLDKIKSDGRTGLRIGARTTIRDIQRSPVIKKDFPALAAAADALASPQIRNLATVGGNICHAAPCADMLPPLIALGAKIKLVGPEGRRTLPLEKFYASPFKTVIKDNELLTEVTVPYSAFSRNSVYLRYTFRGAMDYPYVAIALGLDLEGDRCRDVRIAGSFCSHCWTKEGCRYRCPTPFRAVKTEKLLKGSRLDASLIESAALAASAEAHPVVEREYKKEIIKVITRRALSAAWRGGE